MTTEAVSAAIVPSRPAWHSLLWPVLFHGTVDVVDLLAAGASGQRSSGPGGPTDGPWAHRARVVAWPRTHRPDSRPAPRNLACSHGPIHALDHCRLDSGHQWRIPRGRFDLADAAIGPRDAVELERALDTFAREPNGGAIVTAAASTTAHREFLNSLAMRHRLPTIHAFRYMILSGGLASYGPDTIDIFKRAAIYVDRILKGAKPSELPVQAPTKYELVINLKTAKALGLEMPPSVLATADEVIE